MNELSKEQLMKTTYRKRYPFRVTNKPRKSTQARIQRDLARRKIDDWLLAKELNIGLDELE